MNGDPLNGVFVKNFVDLIVNENLPRPKTKLEINLAISQSTRVYTPYPNLKAEMDAHLLTHNTLAKLLGRSRSNISRKIRGERAFSAEDKIKLVEIFNKPIEWLLWREDKNPAEQKNADETADAE